MDLFLSLLFILGVLKVLFFVTVHVQVTLSFEQVAFFPMQDVQPLRSLIANTESRSGSVGPQEPRATRSAAPRL